MSTRESEHTETRGIEFECASCGRDGLAAGGNHSVTCPDCAATFTVRVVDGARGSTARASGGTHRPFALLERDGWAVTVTVDLPGGSAAAGRTD